MFNTNEQHILDWYHIARRFEAIGKGLVYLPHVEDFEHRLSRHWHHLNRAKWKIWHGNLYGASKLLPGKLASTWCRLSRPRITSAHSDCTPASFMRFSKSCFSNKARKLQNTWPRMVSLRLWQMGRVSRIDFVVRTMSSTVQSFYRRELPSRHYRGC